ncbi:9379_t:CDS:2 [Cetraspora pellucida]|uniref:9379_t:CDS:1 n=1 Tax=Cetraspora pellucida TaxID=1433469 RepID=A0ACA9NPD8_9GLOM|nr:9379_t:CDS:2 [Cetraspora pellucida]
MTHTYINKNGIPIYAEQKIIQTDLKAQDILKTKTPIPDNFLKLENEDIPHSVYISPQILERKPTFGGITIENKKEIIIDEPFSKDQECQTNLTGQQILNQINQLQQEDNLNQQTIIGLQKAKGDNNQELQGQITTLITERDNIQQNLTNLTNKLKRTQKNFLVSLFRSGKKSQQIKDLRIEMIKLRAKLIEKDQQIENLQNQADDLNQQLTLADSTIGTLHQELNQKDDEITELNITIRKLEDEKKVLKDELDIEKGWWDKWLNDNESHY